MKIMTRAEGGPPLIDYSELLQFNFQTNVVWLEEATSALHCVEALEKPKF